jgi:predicted DNA-binding transcriptional regulator AlpA
MGHIKSESAQSQADAQRVVALWGKPVLADSEAAAALGLPRSSWALLKRRGEAPPTFTIGRRVFVRTEDLRAWIDKKAGVQS